MKQRTFQMIPLALCACLMCTGLSAADEALREYWNAPAFKQQLVQSYLSETEIEPRVNENERKSLLKIFELISAEKLDEAQAALRKERSDASTAVHDFTLANIHFQREQLDEAAVEYEAAVKKYPKFRRAWQNLGLVYIRQSQFREALPALTRVIELGGGNAITYGLLGFAYASQENNLSAESAYRAAILLDPDTADWKMGLTRCLFKQQRYADAASLCGQMLAEKPENTDLWLLQANAYIGLNQPMRAAENFELVDRLGKSTFDSLNTLGDIYVNEGIYDLGVDAYVRAIDSHKDGKPDRALRAAKVLMVRGSSPETQRLVEAIERVYAEKLDPEARKDLLKLKARLAAMDGATEAEAAVLTEIIKIDPLDGEALILLGQYHGRAGDTEKAIFYFERAQSLEKFEADAKVRHAQLLVRQNKYAEAIPLLRSAQQINPREYVQKYLEQVERASRR